MSHLNKQFAVADPRTFEGDPYEVADRAVRQAASLFFLAQQATQAARIMVRNAHLERQLAFEQECDPDEFEDSLVAKKIDTAISDTDATVKALEAVAKAAAFNPKARIGR